MSFANRGCDFHTVVYFVLELLVRPCWFISLQTRPSYLASLFTSCIVPVPLFKLFRVVASLFSSISTCVLLACCIQHWS
uniref:Uncharacterized protein n=1 Tax=Aegilops tauschii subsp. strangulata TaxID=200361 RepID=A0A453MFQ4_AEGTS